MPVSGSVEATPRLGLADAIVDLVSTGSTASANGLRLIGTLLSSQAVLIGGARRGRGAARPRRAARADALRRRRGATPALRDDERDDRDAAGDSRRAPEHGRAHRARAGRRGRRSPCTPPSTPTTSGRCCPRFAMRARRRSSCSRSSGSCREGRRARRRDRRRGADRRRRARSWRRGAARVDRAVRRAAAGRASACRASGSRRPHVAGRRARGAARDDPGRPDASTRRSGRVDTAVEAAPGHRLRAPLAPARRRRHLRPERPLPAALVARDGGGAGARRGREADRRRDAEPGRRHARRRPRARPRRGLRDRRRAGGRRARLRHRDDRPASTGSSGRETPTSPPRSSSSRAGSASTCLPARAR